MYLSFGASRWEIGKKLLLKPGLRLALLPTINQMRSHHPSHQDRTTLTGSVIGLVSIPGMMTGAILGGASISQAVRYQQIIMFLISATTTLAVTMSVVACLIVCIDSNHRLRPDRVSFEKPWMWRWRDNVGRTLWRVGVLCWRRLTCRAYIPEDEEGHFEQGHHEHS